MKKPVLIVLCLALGIGVLTVLFSGRYRARVLGWMRGETFSRGQPVSYWIDALKDPDVAMKKEAAAALGELGAEARPAIPALVDALWDLGVRAEVTAALVKIGPEAVPELTRALGRDPQLRDGACQALGKFGPAARPALIDLLKRPEAHLRQGALHALAQAGSGDPESAAAIARAATDASPDVRQAALEGLGALGPATGPTALSVLVDGLHDDYPGARLAAARALPKIGPVNEGAVPALLQAMKKEKELAFVRAAVIDALASIQGRAAEVVKAFGQALRDKDPEVRMRAAAALRRAERAAAIVLGDLIAALQDRSPEFRLGIVQVLAGLGDEAAPAAPALAELLRKDLFEIRFEAARALGGMGKRSADAIPALSEVLLNDQNADVRTECAAALGKMGPTAKSAVADLVLSLHRPKEEKQVKTAVLNALQAIGPDAKAAVPAIVDALSDPSLRAGAAAALRAIDPDLARRLLPPEM